MPPSISRGGGDNPVGERLARVELAADHSIQDRRDIWLAVAALRDGFHGYSGKTDIFLAKADEVLKRVDDHSSSITRIKDEMSEAKGGRKIFHAVLAFGSSLLGGGLVHFFPQIFGGQK